MYSLIHISLLLDGERHAVGTDSLRRDEHYTNKAAKDKLADG